MPNMSTYKELFKQMFYVAMRSGFWIGVLFAFQAFAPFLRVYTGLSFIIYIGTGIAIPVFLVLFAIRYRDRYLGGTIRYAQAVNFMMWCYLFAMIIATLAYYISYYYLFRDPQFVADLEASFSMMNEAFKNTNADIDLKSVLALMNPKSATLEIVTVYMIFGVIYTYIAGLFVKRS